jgi:hypothetical protein
MPNVLRVRSGQDVVERESLIMGAGIDVVITGAGADHA